MFTNIKQTAAHQRKPSLSKTHRLMRSTLPQSLFSFSFLFFCCHLVGELVWKLFLNACQKYYIIYIFEQRLTELYELLSYLPIFFYSKSLNKHAFSHILNSWIRATEKKKQDCRVLLSPATCFHLFQLLETSESICPKEADVSLSWKANCCYETLEKDRSEITQNRFME